MSIVLLFAIGHIFGLAPQTEELRDQRTAFALDTAANLLATTGVEASKQFLLATTHASSPVQLKLADIGRPLECAVRPENKYERRVVSTGRCFQLSAEVQSLGFLSKNMLNLVPWASAMFAAAFAAYWLAHYLTRPVEQVRAGLHALAQGQFEVRIGSSIDLKRDEIAALAHDFNVTAARLEEFRDVQRRLFHDVSHELRSPLSRLQAALGLLNKNPDRLPVMSERIEREVARMDNLIDEILTLARLTAVEAEPLERQTLDLVDLLHEISDDCAFESASRKISLVYEGVDSFVTSVNGELIYRAIENVVRNAAKHSPSNSQILMRTERQDRFFFIIVKDYGPGIPRDILDTIFQPFRRGHNPPADTVGFGLGLAIARHAFACHGGQVHAELPAEGGLLVRMSLPV
ncbi:HAMP domain-containing sensor histidine kinase [Rhizobium sp. AG207R]|uniref:HAMP domain-containing sensor histidine kinase n=1 Tax=Rhizobium sp. AG207R TaxID=2802287 RepID=UPI0022AC7CF7|nr:HAMP domain-containing sensor histidine kinase [Rhizobium sp. AG207R]MCZ3374314.1 HAMP domain-containing histidine kinase [Rhizobium sp. AG207R]